MRAVLCLPAVELPGSQISRLRHDPPFLTGPGIPAGS